MTKKERLRKKYCVIETTIISAINEARTISQLDHFSRFHSVQS